MKSKNLPHLPALDTWVLEAAGISKAEMGRAVAMAFEKVRGQLQARTVKVFQHKGDVVYSKGLKDHSTQHKAARTILEHFLPRIQREQTGRDVYVLPDWAYGEEGRPAATRGGEGLTPEFEKGGVGGKITGPLQGVHEPLAHLAEFEILQPESDQPAQPTQPDQGSQPDQPVPLSQPPPVSQWTIPQVPAQPTQPVQPTTTTTADTAAFGPLDDPDDLWLDEVRR